MTKVPITDQDDCEFGVCANGIKSHVFLEHSNSYPEDGWDMLLTPLEARALAKALTDAAHECDQGGRFACMLDPVEAPPFTLEANP